MNLTEGQLVVWPLSRRRAVATNCFHGWVLLEREKLGFDFVECHKIHYAATLTAFFFLTSLRLF